MKFNITDHSHRRLNPLLNEWVLVSPHRSKRPWQGQVEAPDIEQQPPYDEHCFLCSGNIRINGEINEQYEHTYVFNNDFAALQPNTPQEESTDPLFTMHSERGVSRVLCFSPNHSKSIPELSLTSIQRVISEWINQCLELGDTYNWVQIFENKGSVMGCSNPHPHGQIWAQNNIPSIVSKKDTAQSEYNRKYNSSLLFDYANRELTANERVVLDNEDWLVVVPYWAAWPFETMLLPKFSIQRMTQLTFTQQENLATILKLITTKYDNLFQCSFPYSMGWHGAPYDGKAHTHWQLHASFYPPLLRSASVRKFMVGYEMMAETQRDITPEQAAQMLKNAPSKHYKEV